MPMYQKLVSHFNHAFHKDRIEESAKKADMFAPGKRLDASFVVERDTKLHNSFQGYLDKLPGSFNEAIRGVIYHALSSHPPKPITLAWAPAYDFEMSVWESPCGITIHYRSRYPADPHPTRSNGED
ncbi:MAG TPA: hypothetical protein VII73_04875 [Caulobacteraceae bacterium]